MTGQELVNTGLLLGVGGSLAVMMKDIPLQIWRHMKKRLIYTALVYDTDEMFFALEEWLQKNYYRKYRSIEAGFAIMDYENNDYDPEDKVKDKRKKLQIKQSPSVFIIKWKGKRLMISSVKEKLDHAVDTKKLFSRSISITGIRGKSKIMDFLNHITDVHNSQIDDDSISFYTFYYSSWTCVGRKNVKPLSRIVFNKSVKEMLVEDVRKFRDNKDWYIDSNIPYKRGYLFYGPPGTGKSSLSFALASELKRDCYIVNLSSISSDDALIAAFSRINGNSILLLEDVDSAFVKRDNKESKISFSGLLNCLDGAFSKQGVITIMTTNHIDRLDPALIRAGRIDMQIEMPLASVSEINDYLNIFYSGKCTFDLGHESNDVPMSLVQEICIRNIDNPMKAVEEIVSLTKGS